MSNSGIINRARADKKLPCVHLGKSCSRAPAPDVTWNKKRIFQRRRGRPRNVIRHAMESAGIPVPPRKPICNNLAKFPLASACSRASYRSIFRNSSGENAPILPDDKVIGPVRGHPVIESRMGEAFARENHGDEKRRAERRTASFHRQSSTRWTLHE